MDLNTVMKVIGELSISANKVKELAFKLGVGLSELDDVDQTYHGADQRRNHYMQVWLNKDPDASWDKIKHCLKEMNLNLQASRLSAMVETTDSCSSTTTDSSSLAKSPLEGAPTLPALLRLKIHGQVAARASDFGIFLLDDTQGTTIMSLEKKHQRDGVAVTKEVLELWLQGKGLPVTWKNLIDTLNDIDMCVLASQVEEYAKRK